MAARSPVFSWGNTLYHDIWCFLLESVKVSIYQQAKIGDTKQASSSKGGGQNLVDVFLRVPTNVCGSSSC